MNTISRLALAALLALGAAAVVLPGTALAQDCPPATAAGVLCPPPDLPPPPNDDIPPPPGDDPPPPGDDPPPPPGDDPPPPGDDIPPPPGDDPPPGNGGEPPDDPDSPDLPPPPAVGPGEEEVKLALALDCAIKDEAPMTDDFWIVNVGTQPLPMGLKLKYAVPSTGDHGAFLLPREIQPGEKGVLRDFISEEVAIDSECRIQILPA